MIPIAASISKVSTSSTIGLRGAPGEGLEERFASLFRTFADEVEGGVVQDSTPASEKSGDDDFSEGGNAVPDDSGKILPVRMGSGFSGALVSPSAPALAEPDVLAPAAAESTARQSSALFPSQIGDIGATGEVRDNVLGTGVKHGASPIKVRDVALPGEIGQIVAPTQLNNIAEAARIEVSQAMPVAAAARLEGLKTNALAKGRLSGSLAAAHTAETVLPLGKGAPSAAASSDTAKGDEELVVTDRLDGDRVGTKATSPRVEAVALVRSGHPQTTAWHGEADATEQRSSPAASVASAQSLQSGSATATTTTPVGAQVANVAAPVQRGADPVPSAPTVQSNAAQPQTVADIIESIAHAREAALPHRAELAVRHSEFGKISIRMETGATGAGLSFTLSSQDAGFAPAAQSALAERSALERTAAASSSSPSSDLGARQSEGGRPGNSQQDQQAFQSGSSGQQSHKQAVPASRAPASASAHLENDESASHGGSDPRSSGIFA